MLKKAVKRVRRGLSDEDDASRASLITIALILGVVLVLGYALK